MEISDRQLKKISAGQRVKVPGDTWAEMARELLIYRRAMQMAANDGSLDKSPEYWKSEAELTLIAEGVLKV